MVLLFSSEFQKFMEDNSVTRNITDSNNSGDNKKSSFSSRNLLKIDKVVGASSMNEIAFLLDLESKCVEAAARQETGDSGGGKPANPDAGKRKTTFLSESSTNPLNVHSFTSDQQSLASMLSDSLCFPLWNGKQCRASEGILVISLLPQCHEEQGKTSTANSVDKDNEIENDNCEPSSMDSIFDANQKSTVTNMYGRLCSAVELLKSMDVDYDKLVPKFLHPRCWRLADLSQSDVGKQQSGSVGVTSSLFNHKIATEQKGNVDLGPHQGNNSSSPTNAIDDVPSDLDVTNRHSADALESKDSLFAHQIADSLLFYPPILKSIFNVKEFDLANYTEFLSKVLLNDKILNASSPTALEISIQANVRVFWALVDFAETSNVYHDQQRSSSDNPSDPSFQISRLFSTFPRLLQPPTNDLSFIGFSQKKQQIVAPFDVAVMMPISIGVWTRMLIPFEGVGGSKSTWIARHVLSDAYVKYKPECMTTEDCKMKLLRYLRAVDWPNFGPPRLQHQALCLRVTEAEYPRSLEPDPNPAMLLEIFNLQKVPVASESLELFTVAGRGARFMYSCLSVCCKCSFCVSLTMMFGVALIYGREVLLRTLWLPHQLSLLVFIYHINLSKHCGPVWDLLGNFE